MTGLSKRALARNGASKNVSPVISQVDLTPAQLFREYEAGRISRTQLHAALSFQQKMLLAEAVEYRKNPVLAFLDETLNRRMALKWRKALGEKIVRQALAAMGEMDRFPPAIYIWNADQEDLPLHCFFRARREPVFRILKLDAENDLVEVTVEYGSAKKKEAVREKITFRRELNEKLSFVRRQRLA